MLNFFHRSSSPTGIYKTTVGNNTWPRRCEMNGVEGCGNGAWELVMGIKGDINKVLKFRSTATINTKIKLHKISLAWLSMLYNVVVNQTERLCSSIT